MRQETLGIIDAKGLYYRDLNQLIRQLVSQGGKELLIRNVMGQRYLGCGLKGSDITLTIEGIPGNDLAAFMDGPTIIIKGNAQDGVDNTMNSGKVVIYGDVGDIAGYAMRGGKVYIKGDAGYRLGIHMKSYKELFPILIVGGCARDFLGEYMAWGLIIVLGLGHKGGSIVGNYVGTGMHGGIIYVRGELYPYQLGKEVRISPLDSGEAEILKGHLQEYCSYFHLGYRRNYVRGIY